MFFLPPYLTGSFPKTGSLFWKPKQILKRNKTIFSNQLQNLQYDASLHVFFTTKKKQYLFPLKKIQVPSPPSADRDPERPRRDLPVCWRDVVGWSLWTLGFVVQFTADVQKRIFTADPRNANRWINVGLWRWAQHPNYFGEMCIFGLSNKKMR